MNQNTCCYTGHRKLSENKINQIITRLNEEIEQLIQEGVTTFISGGALGFDQIAALQIIAKKGTRRKYSAYFCPTMPQSR